MNKLSRKTINTIIIIFTLICFLTIYYYIIFNNKLKFKVSVEINTTKEANLTNNIIEDRDVIEVKNEIEKNKMDKESYLDWSLKIPEINLYAEIGEGTSKEIMDKYIGHFEETKLEFGNVGLAAHNRGYPVNFFQDLKELKIGSEITYIHGDFEMVYVVEKIEIIENTNWTYLENTEDNRITLITCVENEPKYRRCIQGVEKIEREEY